MNKKLLMIAAIVVLVLYSVSCILTRHYLGAVVCACSFVFGWAIGKIQNLRR